MNPDTPRYGTSGAFLRALNHRLRDAARVTGRPVEELRREFLTHRFLARVFSRPNSGWVLLGGGGLLVRLPGGRHSRDLDLLHTTSTDGDALLELREVVAEQRPDPLTFQLGPAKKMSGLTTGARIMVTALAGPSRAGTFPVDLSTERTIVARTERIRPRPIIELDDVAPLPEFVLYPLPDQVADKVCTIYGRYGSHRSPSTRYHDLVDLVLILRGCQLDAAQTRTAIRMQEARRGFTVPVNLTAPGAVWSAGYRASAQNSSLPPALHELDDALTAVRTFLAPLLTDSITAGLWNPHAQAWG